MKLILSGPPLIGKTTLLKELEKLNIKVFNADDFVHKSYQKNNVGYNLIKEEWGERFLNEKGVDRKKLGQEAAKNHEILFRLSEIINPMIEYEYNQNDYQVAEIPLTISTKINLNYDKIILLSPKENNLLKTRVLKSKRKVNANFIDFIIKNWNDKNVSFDEVFVIDETTNYHEIALQIKNDFF